MLSNQELKTQISAFLDDFSIETSPHDADKFKNYVDVIKPGTRIYIAHLPGLPLEEVIRSAGSLRRLGFKPVPHLVSRKFVSRDQLDSALAELKDLDIDHALVLGGDSAVEGSPFDSSLEVLETGLFEKYGFRQVGIAGHPEGSKAIGDEIARQALIDKSKFAAGAPFRTVIVTQFGFDAQPWIDWEASSSADGVNLDVHVGLAGPASLRQLVRYAMACGVGASLKMLTSRTGATANLLRTQAPDDLVVEFANHRAAHPDCRLRGVHFFAFGGVIKAARWANAVVAGDFDIEKSGAGFKVAS